MLFQSLIALSLISGCVGLTCPAGSFVYYTNPITPMCSACSSGKYQSASNFAGTVCTSCAPGYYQPATGASSCNSKCGTGTYSVAGSASCTYCTLGTYMPQTNASACWNCSAGQFSGIYWTYCSTCPAGSTTNATTPRTCGTCTPPCTPTPCSVGQTWPPCDICTSGTYASSPGSVACFPCSTGSFQTAGNSTACVLCSAGLYQSVTGATTCLKCWQGSYQNGTGSTCLACSSGSFASQIAATVCSACSPGTFQTGAGALVCQPCASGSFQNATGSSTCAPCPSGFFANTTGLTGCSLCIQGTYQNLTGGTRCLQCQEGSFQNSFAASACLLCPNGTFSNATGAALCSACLPGQYQNQTGRVDCLACPAGAFQSEYGGTLCNMCKVGQYQNNPMSSTCVSCEQGSRYNTMPASTGCNTCTQCAARQFFQSACTPSSDSLCSNCGSCQLGWYEAGSCVRGSSSDSSFTQPTYCQPCPPCPNGTFLSDGCVNGALPVCSPCTVCETDPLVQCTALSDTICGGVSDCRHNSSLEVLPWLLPSHYCEQGQYVLALSSTTGEPTCAQCPPGTYGPNGLWCDVCPGYKTAYFDASQCVCYQGTVENVRGQCDCLAGNEFLDILCLPCASGSYDDTVLELGDEWWTQYKACRPCPNGTDSLPGATACTACPFGMYREAPSTELCRNCTESGWYAPDPTSGASCVPCNASCEPGYYPTKCPTYAGQDRFLCEPCPGVPLNATSTAPVGATANTACNWACDAGFFQANASACVPCTAGACPAGFNRSACTPLADSDCDTPCVDKDKPLRNSVWTSGCAWACAEGYELSAADYVLWVQYSCVAAGARLFDMWG